MNRRALTVLIAVAVATVVAGAQAVLDLSRYGYDGWVPWIANVDAAVIVSSVVTAAYLVTSGNRVALFLFTLSLPFLLFASMMPVYAAVRWDVPAAWQFVCPSEAQAFAAPLAVLASLCVLPLAKRWRGL